MRTRKRLLGAAVGLMAAASLTVVPLAAGPVAAQLPPNIHWGVSPFYPNCIEGPCRVVIIADKTADPTFELQVQRWAFWMNHVRNNFNLKLPAFGYVGPAQGLQPDPGCAVANGVISVCRNDAVVDADCNNPGPSTIRCTTYNVTLGDQHILWAKTSFRNRALDPADVWNVVCAGLGRSIGMPPSSDPNSCLQGSITLGTGQEKYYVGSDWSNLFNLYEHAAGS